jgi:hypothetical protein
MAKFVTRARRDSGQASIIVNFDAFTHVVPGASAIVLCILRTGFGRYVVLPHHPVRRRRFPSGAKKSPG